MSRTLNLKNLYAKKFKTFPFTGIWQQVMGHPETCGVWIIYGRDKNGKTWFCLKLAEYLSSFEKALYVSAEEGIAMDFVAACQRAGLDPNNNRLQFTEYLLRDELEEKLKNGRTKVVFIDNITFYAEELKYGWLRKLKDKYPKVLWVYIAHEDETKKGQPATATAKLAKKLAKVIVHVQGLACFVSGRVPGGVISIDEEKAMLYHGMQEITNTD